MIGLSKEEAIETIKKLDNAEIANVFNGIVPRLRQQYQPNSPEMLDAFLREYVQKILIPIAAELIEANNRKLEQDIKTLLAKP